MSLVYLHVLFDLFLDLLMGLPSEKLSVDSVDQQNNSALHLACLKVSANVYIAVTLM